MAGGAWLEVLAATVDHTTFILSCAHLYQCPLTLASPTPRSGEWFRTGDVGEVQENGALKIIDRAKNMFKLAQGEYVSSEVVEAALKKNTNMDQIFVYGEVSLLLVLPYHPRHPSRLSLQTSTATLPTLSATLVATTCSPPRRSWYALTAERSVPPSPPPLQSTEMYLV